MKKLILTLVAAFMVVAVAGTASAAIGYNTMTAVLYDSASETGKEMAVSLGDFTDVDGSIGFTYSFNMDDLGVGSWSDVNVGVFSMGFTPTYSHFIYGMAKTKADAPEANPNAGFFNAANNVYGYHDAGVSIMPKGPNEKSFFQEMDGKGTAEGSYNNFNVAATAPGFAVLPEDGTVELFLYKYMVDTTVTYDDLILGTPEAKITFTTAGDMATIEVASAAVPVPGAVFILGSGLLALVGLRRKY